MTHSIPRLLLLTLCLFILVGVSGCWINLNAQVESTPVAQNLPTEQPTETPTEEPTEEPTPTEEFIPQDVTEEFIPDDFAAVTTDELLPTDTLEFAEPTAFFVTETPDPGTQVAQVIPTDAIVEEDPVGIDPFVLSATALVATSTQQIIDITLTYEADFAVTNFSPTPDPITVLPVDTPTPDPGTGGIPPVTGSDCIYVVNRGDNLFRIGIRYNVPFQEIARVNGITNVNFIVVGQELTIPGCGTGGVVPRDGGTTGGTTGGTVGGTTGGSCASPYVVDQGDTLFQISLRCNIPVRTIAAANGIPNINLIYIDQVLNLP
jgi:LysM repeat protein